MIVLTFADHLNLILIAHVQRVLDVVVDLALLLDQLVQFVFRIVDRCQNLLITVHDCGGQCVDESLEGGN